MTSHRKNAKTVLAETFSWRKFYFSHLRESTDKYITEKRYLKPALMLHNVQGPLSTNESARVHIPAWPAHSVFEQTVQHPTPPATIQKTQDSPT